MIFKKGLVQSAVAGATLAAGLALATPSQAVITTFASYSAVNTGSNIYWKNNGTTATNGTGGSLYTIGSGSSTTPGTTKIDFSFLQPALASQVGNVIADFTLLGSVTNSPALTSGGFKIQPLISGSFSILSTSAITVNGTTYAAGANLLSGTFDQTTIFGATNATSGSASSATTSGGTITYSSDFLKFDSTVAQDFSLSLTSIARPLSSADGRALRSFAAVSTGSFSTDPAPVIPSVPEAATWAMFISGFGLMGASLRRRRPAHATA
jgi:hypothetical protein